MGFGRACAPVRCAQPSFGALKHVQRGAARPPPAHRSFAAFSLYFKNKNNLPNSGRPREGLFSFNSTREYTECQAFYPVVRIGSTHPLICKRVLLPPPFGSKGGGTFTSGWGCGGKQFQRWGIHSGTLSICTITIIPRRLRLWNLMSPDPPHIGASLILLANNKKKKTAKKSQYGGVSCDINYMSRKPREMSQFCKKSAKLYHCLYSSIEQLQVALWICMFLKFGINND